MNKKQCELAAKRSVCVWRREKWQSKNADYVIVKWFGIEMAEIFISAGKFFLIFHLVEKCERHEIKSQRIVLRPTKYKKNYKTDAIFKSICVHNV